jgi:hypothetical protein
MDMGVWTCSQIVSRYANVDTFPDAAVFIALWSR